MRTIGDIAKDFYASWIRPSDVDEPNEIPEDILEPDEYGTELEKYEPQVGKKIIDAVMCRKMALTCPLFDKGVEKKSSDTFRPGFLIGKNGKHMQRNEQIWIDDFNRRNNILKLLKNTKKNAHIYGHGVWFIRYREELDRKVNYSSAPPKNALPFKVKLLDPECIKRYEYKNSYWKTKGVKHLLYQKSNGAEYYIHPDRMEMFIEKELPFTKFGISDVVVLRHIIGSTADVDIAVGKILAWHSHGIIEWNKSGSNAPERKEMKRILKTHPDAFVGDENYSLKVHNPEAIDPKSFYEYLTMCIAAVLVMPTHILTGVRVGRVTGAEAGFTDYQKDISDVQNLVYNPKLNKIYQKIFTAHNDKTHTYIFDYDIEWNHSYVNEMAEAELDFKRAEAIEKLIDKGIISIPEAREMMNRGHVELSKKIPDDLAKPETKEQEKKIAAYKKIIKAKKDLFESLSNGQREVLLQDIRVDKAQSNDDE